MFARVKCDPDLVHGGVWKPCGDVETPKLEDTRRARSVDNGSISMLSVTSKAEAIFEFRLVLTVVVEDLPRLLTCIAIATSTIFTSFQD